MKATILIKTKELLPFDLLLKMLFSLNPFMHRNYLNVSRKAVTASCPPSLKKYTIMLLMISLENTKLFVGGFLLSTYSMLTFSLKFQASEILVNAHCTPGDLYQHSTLSINSVHIYCLHFDQSLHHLQLAPGNSPHQGGLTPHCFAVRRTHVWVCQKPAHLADAP